MTELCVDTSSIRVCHMDQYVSGVVGSYKVHFTFSDDWADLAKTITFRADDVSRSTFLDAEDTCIIPWEVLVDYNRLLRVGVDGRDEDGNIILTVWKSLRIIEEGALSGEPTEPPTQDWYDQVLALLSDVPSIMTADELDQIIAGKPVARKNVYLNSDRTRELWNEIQNYVDQNGGSGGGETTTGVLSFNGRTGHVISEHGDYDHSLVGMEPITNKQLEVMLK